MRPYAGIGLLWLVWIVVWILSALRTNATLTRAPTREEIPFRIATLIGAILLGFSGVRVQGLDGALGWAVAGIVALGLGFSIWARFHLGRLWSARVTRKEDHRVVDSGPYRLVRHPIYTGVILALFATAAAQGRWLAILGAAIIAFGFVLKARMEEKFLRRELGTAYDSYAARTPMLIPFWRRTG